MANKTPFILTLILLSTTLCYLHLTEKPQYRSPDTLKHLKIPHRPRGWRSKDMTQALKLERDDRYKFINDIFARLYTNEFREEVLFLILDAGNFHNPKVCFKSSGHKIQEIDPILLKTPDGSFYASAIEARKPNGNGYLLVYWMVINQRRTNWQGQKFQEFFSSLLGKQKEGLMIRLDIPFKKDTRHRAIKIAQSFIHNISYTMPPQTRRSIFGLVVWDVD